MGIAQQVTGLSFNPNSYIPCGDDDLSDEYKHPDNTKRATIVSQAQAEMGNAIVAKEWIDARHGRGQRVL